MLKENWKRKILFKLLKISGLPFVFREIIQKNKVTILLFHDIDRKTAEQNFSFLSKNYNIISLEDFIYSIERKDSSKIPKKALIITFDDGHIRNYEILPVIKKYNLPLTIFLCSSIINTNRHYWFKFKNDKISVYNLKYRSNIDKLKILSEFGFEQDKEFDRPQALQKHQIDEMKSIINMQSHTKYHPCLPKCNYIDAKNEIFGSKDMLEKKYNLQIDTLAYPNGDYSERDILLLKEAGYKCGVTTDYGFNTINSDIYKLKRISVNDAEDMNELIVKASGLWAFFKTRNGRKQEFGFTNDIEI